MRAARKLKGLACLLVLTSFLAGIRLGNPVQPTADINGSVPPVIQDFYISNVYSGLATEFSFSCLDSVALSVGILQTNVTGQAANTTLNLSGVQAWANYTLTYPSGNSVISFDFWVNDSNNLWATTGNRAVNVYDYTDPATVSYFNSLSQAVTTVQAANDFSQVSPYLAYVLCENQTSMQTMIDNYAATQQWLNVLEYAAICNKLWSDNVPSDVQTDIQYALGNYTMVGNLPFTDANSGVNDFTPESEWALYGYYFNNCSWMGNYQNDTKWNITAAYSFFDTAVNYSIANNGVNGYVGLPLWIYADGTGSTFGDRYYDEDANTIECYLLFAELLNVSDAMNKAVYWWNYLVSTHWTPDPGYFGYAAPGGLYECEAGFFMKIISMLEYYYPSLGNWTYVLEDIDNRFLSQEWNSPQWVDATTHLTTYAVVHADPGNPQRRLESTLGAWQALQGVYLQLNSVYQGDVTDMLSGNENLQPAWALLLSQYNPSAQQYGAGLYDAATGMFGESRLANSGCGAFVDDANATAQAEILLFMLGIVPGTTTVAFPLEELNDEYIQDINPEMFQFNLANQTITIPVNSAGTMTFQYGESPITCSFNQTGVWQVTFTDSWNMIANVTYVSGLPTNSIYFSQIYQSAYNATINADCITDGSGLNVTVTLDGSPTGYPTPCTFNGLMGTHTFTMSNTGPDGQIFLNWTTGETTPTITVSAEGTFTAYYEAGPLSVTVSPDTGTMGVLQSQSFTSTVFGGTLPYAYQWCLNDTPVQGANFGSWNFTPSSVGQCSIYVNVTDNTGLVAESNIASVTVPSISVNVWPASAVMNVAQSQMFNSTVLWGTAPYSYQWYLNDVPLSGATNSTWAFTPKSAGPYTVYVNVTDSDGTQATSNTAYVQANVQITSVEGPYHTRDGMEYWVVGLSGEHSIRIVSKS